MRKILLAFITLLLLLGVVFFAQLRLGIVSALFIRDFLVQNGKQEPHGGSLAWVSSKPTVSRLSLPVGDREIKADLYYVQDKEKRAAILLTHGLIATGKEDPRLIRFATSLARAGFVVLIPELRGMKSLRILPSDVDDIVGSFRFLASLNGQVDEDKMGLLGFSLGAGLTAMAASHPSVRSQVEFLVLFGGYFDSINVIRFITTGYYEYQGKEGSHKPDPYGKEMVFLNNLDYVQSEQDRRILKEIFTNEALERKNERKEIHPLLGRLSPKGLALYELLVNEDPNRVEGLIRRTDRRFQDYLDWLSLGRVVPSVEAYLIIGHGTSDSLIPYTESLRLADAVKDKNKVHLAILNLFAHVDPSQKSYSIKDYLTVYLPSIFHFYLLIYDLLSQQL